MWRATVDNIITQIPTSKQWVWYVRGVKQVLWPPVSLCPRASVCHWLSANSYEWGRQPLTSGTSVAQGMHSWAGTTVQYLVQVREEEGGGGRKTGKGGREGGGRDGRSGRVFWSSSMTCLSVGCAKFSRWLAFLTLPAAAADDEMTAKVK